MSRRRGGKPTGIQLFTFLDVMICTMGALLVLLHAFADHDRDETEKVAAEAQQKQAEQDEIDADFFRWRSVHLRESRTKTQADLEAERLKLSHIEEHQRRLEERLNQLKIAVAELDKTDESDASQRAEKEAELAKTQQELASARAAIDESRTKGKHEAVNYSIVPFEGRNGTHRRPIYIECCENKIVLQPEGIELLPEDFIGYFGPGNPLAAGLRAQREYFARMSPGGTLAEEPYPLLIVRPEGIASYYAARAALDSWGTDFGYELIGADWTLSYPPSDPQLKELTAQVVTEARQRLTEYIATSPQFQRRRSRPVYHAKSHGGISQEPGTGDDPGGSFLGEWDNPENFNGTAGGPRGRGGSFAAGADGDRLGNAGGSGGAPDLAGSSMNPYAADPYAPYGATGGDPYAEPSSIGPQMMGGQSQGQRNGSGMNGSPGSMIDGNQFSQMQRGSSGPGAAGTGPGGVEPQDGPYGGSGPSRSFEGAGGGGMPQTRIGSATVGGGPSHAQSPTGTAKPGGDGQPGTMQQAGQPGAQQSGQPSGQSANNYHLMAGQGQASSGGTPDSAQFARDASKLDPSQMASPDGAVPNGSPGESSMNPPHAGKRGKATQSIAVTRGKGWGVNGQVGAIGATRPILVRCSADKLVIVPETRGQPANEISLGPSTVASIDDLVSGIWTHSESWGKAGRGMYWKPTLVVEVLPGGESRFEDLQVLLNESGLEVQRRGARPAAGQAVRPTNQR